MREYRILLMILGAIISGSTGLGFIFINDQVMVSKFRVGIMLLCFCVAFMTEMYQKLKE
jgi:hypothetical protein